MRWKTGSQNLIAARADLSSFFCAKRLKRGIIRHIVIAMTNSVLYLGDTELAGAASYLAGVMHAHDISFDYLPCDEAFSSPLLSPGRSVVILSDYPARNFSPDRLDALAEKVNKGMGLLMIGGWESFTGQDREYTDTVLKDVLPVVMQGDDDRVNCAQPCLIEKVKNHEILGSLPFEKYPPGIGGFNRFTANPDAETILLGRSFEVSLSKGSFTFNASPQADPLLVAGVFGRGRVCAFASDVAPHWVGGLVDWGNKRLEAHAPGANAIEVGNWYATFFVNLVKWTGQLP